MNRARIHETALIEDSVSIGEGSKVWANTHIRFGVKIGKEVVIGEHVYIGPGVSIGNHVKIQNLAQIYDPAIIESEVFVGPGVICTNDKYPRATNLDGSQKSATDWKSEGVKICRGASIGAGAILVAPVSIGEFALIASGSVVIQDVSPFALVAGNPAKWMKWVGKAGVPLKEVSENEYLCPITNARYVLNSSGKLNEL